nr:hemicentin-2-like [Cherax quadricarinatus]
MKELSANYNKLLNFSVVPSHAVTTFEEDFHKLADIAHRVKDLSKKPEAPTSTGVYYDSGGSFAVESVTPASPTAWGVEGTERPSIVESLSSNVTVRAGDTATLTCHVNNLGDATVSWVRNKDLSIVAVGPFVYVSSDRFQVRRHEEEHQLNILRVEENDQGVYECQVSVEPLVIHQIWLTLYSDVEEEEEEEEVEVVAEEVEIPNIVESLSSNVTVRTGNIATLTCHVINLGDSTVYWYRDRDINVLAGGSDVFIMDERFRVVHDNSEDWKIEITGVRASDAGWYKCVVIAPSVINHKIYLAVEGREARIVTEESNRNATVKEGDTATLNCRVKNLDTDTVTWTRMRDQYILTAAEYTFSPDERFSAVHEGEEWRLQIDAVNKRDEGEYECQVSTTPATTQVFFLKVIETQGAPGEVSVPSAAAEDSNKEVWVVPGDTATLTCPILDPGNDSVSWIRGRDQRLLTVGIYTYTNEDRFSVPRQEQVKSWQLQIHGVRESDSGEYECQVSTRPPTSWILRLRVEDPYWPKMDVAPTDVHTVEGKTVTLTCRASSQVQPVITWTKNDLPLTSDRYQITHDGDLVLSAVSVSDTGHYVCSAVNPYGSVESGAQLRVEETTRIIRAPRDRVRGRGEAAVFRCKVAVDSDLELNVNWLVNGVLVDYDKNPRLLRQPKNGLTVSLVTEDDAGVYTCVASTPLDSVNASATLTVRGAGKSSKPVPIPDVRVPPARHDSPCPPPYNRIKDTLCILQVTDQKMNWRDAREYCRSEGGDLAWETDNIVLRTFLEELYGLGGVSWTQWPFWVGGREHRESTSESDNNDNLRKGGSTASGKGGTMEPETKEVQGEAVIKEVAATECGGGWMQHGCQLKVCGRLDSHDITGSRIPRTVSV